MSKIKRVLGEVAKLILGPFLMVAIVGLVRDGKDRKRKCIVRDEAFYLFNETSG